MIRHRYRAPAWSWWPGAVGGALPHVVVVLHLLTGGTWAAAMFVEIWVMAATVGVTLSTVPASVLDAAELEHLVPELIVALPIGQPIEVANRIVDPAIRYPGVDHFHVDSVLVHDLRFEVTTAAPERVRAAIDREGILADALGRYTSEVGTGLIRISYTGPLLSDDLVQRVQDGVARGAGTTRDQVRVGPRSTLGVGVDMAKEPQEAVAEDHDQGEDHDHH